MTVLFFIMTVHNDCPVCEKWPNKPVSSHKNVRPVLIVMSEFLGYNASWDSTKHKRRQKILRKETEQESKRPTQMSGSRDLLQPYKYLTG